MNTGEISLTKRRQRLVIVISQVKPKFKKSMVVIFLIFIIFGFSVPIITLIFAISDIKITFIVTIMIFWGTAIYLLRLLLWNLYGKEVFFLEDNKLTFYNDYRFFKDNFKEESFTDYEIGISEYKNSGLGISEFKPIQLIKNNADSKVDGYFQIRYDEQIIHSSIKVSIDQMIDVAKDIYGFLTNTR